MKRYILLSLLAVALFSCRPMSDDLPSYGTKDYNAFSEANKSFAGQFKELWLAMNENYGIWDYELAHGVDWDEVYTTFLPKFEALDDTVNRKTKVSDAELIALYAQFLDSLHDGHLELQIKNRHTGNFLTYMPSKSRLMRERGEEMNAVEENITNLNFYCKLDPDDQLCAGAYDATSSALIVTETVDTVCARATRAATAYIEMVNDAGGPNVTNDSLYVAMNRFCADCSSLRGKIESAKEDRDSLKWLIYLYDLVRTHYDIVCAQLDIQLPKIDSKMGTEGLRYIYSAVFNGGIAYLRIGAFGLLTYLEGAKPADTTSLLYFYHRAVNRVWENWFDTIQALSANNELGGIIIDLRNNSGGMLDDNQYVLGALLPSGGYDSHHMRLKNGIGRLDFAPTVPFHLPTYGGKHAVITEEPIVVLGNCRSISMSEMTIWGVKSQPNGYFIGTRTWGGLSALDDEESAYSQSYSGCFGVYNETSFYGYVPRFVSMFGEDKQILEGVGITPDKEVPLDVNYWRTQMRDNQLEAALDYIRAH